MVSFQIENGTENSKPSANIIPDRKSKSIPSERSKKNKKEKRNNTTHQNIDPKQSPTPLYLQLFWKILYVIIVPFFSGTFFPPIVNLLLPPNTSFTFQFIILLVLWMSFTNNILNEEMIPFKTEKLIGGFITFFIVYWRFFSYGLFLVWPIHYFLVMNLLKLSENNKYQYLSNLEESLKNPSD